MEEVNGLKIEGWSYWEKRSLLFYGPEPQRREGKTYDLEALERQLIGRSIWGSAKMACEVLMGGQILFHSLAPSESNYVILISLGTCHCSFIKCMSISRSPSLILPRVF